MRKHLLWCCLFVLFILSLTACKKKEDTVKGFAPPMKGVTWGMTRQDYVKKLEEGTYEMIDLQDSIHTSILMNDSMKLFGADARVYLLFSTDLCKKPEDGGRLQAVILRYDGANPDELLSQIKKELGDDYKESVNVLNIKNYVWQSSDLLKDIPKKEFNDLVTFMSNTDKAKVIVNTDNGAAPIVPTENFPINAITLHEINTDTGKSQVVTYYGDWAYLSKVLQEEQ